MLGWIHGIYYSITGIWPIVDIKSFLLITGYKNDLWLVKTVGILTLVIAIPILYASWKKRFHSEILILTILSCTAFMMVDITYSLKKIISPIYMIDAGAQFILLLSWLIIERNK